MAEEICGNLELWKSIIQKSSIEKLKFVENEDLAKDECEVVFSNFHSHFDFLFVSRDMEILFNVKEAFKSYKKLVEVFSMTEIKAILPMLDLHSHLVVMGKILREMECIKNNEELAIMLIENGADLFYEWKDEDHVLRSVWENIYYFGSDLIKNIVDQKLFDPSQVNDVYRDGYTQLHRACHLGDVEKVKKIISLGVDINRKTRFDCNMYPNCTPLNIAIMEEAYKIVQILLEAGACPNEPMRDEEDIELTPLMYACKYEDERLLDILKPCIKEGKIDVNYENEDGETALEYVCVQNSSSKETFFSALMESGQNLKVTQNIIYALMENTYTDEMLDKILDFITKEEMKDIIKDLIKQA